MTIRFDGRTVIVTGAGSGLGRSYALELARRGAHVVVNDLGSAVDGRGASRRPADHVVKEIRASGGIAVPSYDSVADEAGCKRVVATAVGSFGSADALVHSAGVLRNAMFEAMTDEDLWPVLQTQLLGAIHLARAVYPGMVERGYGRLVFTSSGSGMFGRTNGANYAVAMAGIVGFVNALALEAEPYGVLVNAVMPAAYTRLSGAPEPWDTSEAAEVLRSEARALRPRSLPEWVAPMVAYLASEACDRTRRYYSAIEGRYARVFVGATRGWLAEGPTPPSAEDVQEHLDEIEDLGGFVVPDSVYHEVEVVRRRRD
ncbi:MAG TPA: SDR family NAD(P)-dependent oxidoreductase [Acidimicrobiales bacterium]|nr:SDR family NAD(P)-dependent oxidoreductase [Acidimicrobiales bacterium]